MQHTWHTDRGAGRGAGSWGAHISQMLAAGVLLANCLFFFSLASFPRFLSCRKRGIVQPQHRLYHPATATSRQAGLQAGTATARQAGLHARTTAARQAGLHACAATARQAGLHAGTATASQPGLHAPLQQACMHARTSSCSAVRDATPISRRCTRTAKSRSRSPHSQAVAVVEAVEASASRTPLPMLLPLCCWLSIKAAVAAVGVVHGPAVAAAAAAAAWARIRSGSNCSTGPAGPPPQSSTRLGAEGSNSRYSCCRQRCWKSSGSKNSVWGLDDN